MRGKILLTFLACCLAIPAVAQDAAAPEEPEFDPSTLTLEDIIACKADVPSYTRFVFWFHENKAAYKHYGLKPVHGGENPFLSEYRLARPITVFGQTTNHIAFTSSALLAVLSGVTAQEMADQLEVRDGGDFMGKFLAERVVSEQRFDEAEFSLHGFRRITLNVSTVTSHPDRVLVGCSYRFKFDDEDE